MKKSENSNFNINAILKQRGTWGNISPITKVIPNKKKNHKEKHKGRRYNEDE